MLDIFGILSYQEIDAVLQKSNTEAIQGDWQAVMDDIEDSIAIERARKTAGQFMSLEELAEHLGFTDIFSK